MKIIDLKQNTPEWLEFRKDHIGASEAPIIMGESPWCTPYILWRRKLGLEPEQETNIYMQRGVDLEPKVRELLYLQTDIEYTPMVATSKEYPFMSASFDGVDLLRERFVEIKCPNENDHNLAINGQIPSKYLPQLCHQLIVSGADYIDYVSYDGENITIVKCGRDNFNNDYIENLIEKEKEFFNNLQTLTPPLLSNKDYTKRNDPKWINDVKAYKEAKEMKEFWECQEKEIRGSLITLSGGSNTMGEGLSLSKIAKKGVIDYSLIPELIGVNLEEYRKKPIEYWKINLEK